MIEQLRKGLIYTTLGQYGNVLVNFIVNAILSRILTPKEYGIVAVISVFIVFFQVLSDMGIGPSIIQNKMLTQVDVNNIFGFSFYFSLLLSVIFIFIGVFLSTAYSNPIYNSLSQILSISLFFYTLNIVPQAILKKDKMFKTLNIILVVSALFSGSFGILFSCLGFGVYSLVWMTVINSIMAFIFTFINSKISFKLTFRKESLAMVSGFAKNQFGFGIVNYFSRNTDTILIGKFIGGEAVGSYNKAYQLLMYPATIFNGIINPVLQPILSDFQEDVVRIKTIYLKIIHFLMLLGIPISIYLSMNSQRIIFFIFGNQWSDSVYPFSILALSIWTQMVAVTTSSIFQARNKTNLLLISGLINSTIIITLVIIGVIFQSIDLVATLLSFGYFFTLCVTFYFLLYKVLNSNFYELVNEMTNSIFIGMGTFITMLLYNEFTQESNFGSLVSSFIIFSFIYFILLYYTKEYKFILSFINKKEEKQ
jgi:PST family polysaccharide transporter